MIPLEKYVSVKKKSKPLYFLKTHENFWKIWIIVLSENLCIVIFHSIVLHITFFLDITFFFNVISAILWNKPWRDDVWCYCAYRLLRMYYLSDIVNSNVFVLVDCWVRVMYLILWTLMFLCLLVAENVLCIWYCELCLMFLCLLIAENM